MSDAEPLSVHLHRFCHVHVDLGSSQFTYSGVLEAVHGDELHFRSKDGTPEMFRRFHIMSIKSREVRE